MARVPHIVREEAELARALSYLPPRPLAPCVSARSPKLLPAPPPALASELGASTSLPSTAWATLAFHLGLWVDAKHAGPLRNEKELYSSSQTGNRKTQGLCGLVSSLHPYPFHPSKAENRENKQSVLFSDHLFPQRTQYKFPRLTSSYAKNPSRDGCVWDGLF